VALVVLGRAAELRGAEIDAQRNAVESAMLCERMQASTKRIERYWSDSGPATGTESRDSEEEWAIVIADVIRLVDLLRSADEIVESEITAAVRPLTELLRHVGLGTVYAAADEILHDWTRLQTLAGPHNYLRRWEAEWIGLHSIDMRSFKDVLETLGQPSSHAWQDFFARLPAHGTLSGSDMALELRKNALLALRFLHDTATILMRIRGRAAVPSAWQTAQVAYEQYLATRYIDQQNADAVVTAPALRGESGVDRPGGRVCSRILSLVYPGSCDHEWPSLGG